MRQILSNRKSRIAWVADRVAALLVEGHNCETATAAICDHGFVVVPRCTAVCSLVDRGLGKKRRRVVRILGLVCVVERLRKILWAAQLVPTTRYVINM